MDLQLLRYVGWDSSSECFARLFSELNMQQIQKTINQILMDKMGKNIIVPMSTIKQVMMNNYRNHRPGVGDPYQGEVIRSDCEQIMDRTVQVIVVHVENDYRQRSVGQNFSVWSNLMGEGNKFGLRQHPPIKLRRSRPASMQFFQNY